MVELRKRPAPPPAPPAPKKKATGKSKAAKPEQQKAPVAAAIPATSAPAANGGGQAPKTGDSITLDGFGGEVETNDSVKTTLSKLVEESKAGVVLFTYPKASTPGCTTQACLFRDSYAPLTATGLKIYGLSNDSPKANTTFKTKQNLPYPLLCDPAQTLIRAIGMKKAPSGTQRGVFVVGKDGKVLLAQPASPAESVEVVKALVEKMGGAGAEKGVGRTEDKKAENKAVAAVAAEVADTAATIDKSRTGTPA